LQNAITQITSLNEGTQPVLNVFGPTVQFFATPAQAEEALCVMKGVIPPGVPVPIHSHAGVECFFMVSGQQDILIEKDGQFLWTRCKPGDFIQVPSEVKHAFRNPYTEPAVSLVTTTAKLGRFFEEIGREIAQDAPPAPPTPEALQHFMETAIRYGYWLASPQENAAVGISLF
jgi:quercetin dioxygenase-like cupin family protein